MTPRLSSLLLVLAALIPAARAQTSDQVYRFLVPLEGITHEAHIHDGVVTVGVGHRLPSRCVDHRGQFTDAQINAFYAADYAEALRGCRAYYAGFDSLPLGVKLVCFSLAWTSGSAGLARYPAFGDALQHHMWDLAAYNLVMARGGRHISDHRAWVEYKAITGADHS